MKHVRFDHDVQLKISIPKATPDELQRGLEEAMAVFRNAGINPQDAATGIYARACYDDQYPTGPEVSDAEWAAADAWDDADAAALEAACAGWREAGRHVPETARLELVTDPATQLVDRAAALAMLRAKIEGSRHNEHHDSTVVSLAWIVAEDLEDQWHARKLVDDVTIAFSRLSLAGFYPDEPIEPKRQAAFAAIAALEKAT